MQNVSFRDQQSVYIYIYTYFCFSNGIEAGIDKRRRRRSAEVAEKVVDLRSWRARKRVGELIKSFKFCSQKRERGLSLNPVL